MTLKEDREREKSRREALGKFLYNLGSDLLHSDGRGGGGDVLYG